MKAKNKALYDHGSIEEKWQKTWEATQVYKTEDVSTKEKMYVLDMFPYPSGAGLHVGHPRGYIGTDIFSRMKRMKGYNVLHPMGYDAFGLPAEQYAIKHKIHPREAVEENVATFERQLSFMGLSYDWSRKVNTTDPAYYKWTQWIFLKLYDSWYDYEQKKARPIAELLSLLEKEGNKEISAEAWNALSAKAQHDFLMNYRIAYEGYSTVNWSPSMGTVLANDEVVVRPDGSMVSERDEQPVEKKLMRQWFMRITAYADRLLEGLEHIEWPPHIKEIQKNWIGKSEGSEIDFTIAGTDKKITIFTTRADTLFGATYVVLAPEHPLVEELLPQIQNADAVQEYIQTTARKDETDRTSTEKEKTGVLLEGVVAINPANGEQIPIWIADYVLSSYGTGAVMAVPAHDERDFAFAKKFNLPMKEVIVRPEGATEGAYTDYGIVTNSIEWMNGLLSEDAIEEIIEELSYKGTGRRQIKYKMRDAVFARQRYWGEPIPLRHKEDGTIAPLTEAELPLTLPDVSSYEPTGTGESPLASVPAWVSEGYETNTMPGWAGSSWYFLRYMDPHNTGALASEAALSYWKDVDVYVGGAEHATGHLLYSRFWHKFLYDLGVVPTEEPFAVLRNQGLILASDGRKMSKRWGNVINPDDIVNLYGADTLRVYEMFMGPFEASLPWFTESIIGSRRFIERVWRLSEKVVPTVNEAAYQKALHKCIKKVTEDIEQFAFNTAVSAMMICLNELEKAVEVSEEDYTTYLKILAPFAPHMTEELWSMHGGEGSIHVAPWPSYDESKLVEDAVTIGVQINGKVRAEVSIPMEATKEEMERLTLEVPKIKELLAGQEPKKVIAVPGRVINIVI